MFLAIIYALLAFIVILLAHELGHFITAKLTHVKVEEFGVFLPPRLLSFKKGETVYSLNLIPFGGFNKLAGEEDPNVPGSLASKSKKVRLLVLSAGALMNLLLPFILLPISFMIPHFEAAGGVRVVEVKAASPAATSGIIAGDIILKINGDDIADFTAYSTIVKASGGITLTVTVQKPDGTLSELELTPRVTYTAEEGATGLLLENVTGKVAYPVWEAIPLGIKRYWEFILLYRDGIVETIKGTIPFEVTGPVGIVHETGKVAQIGFGPLLQFASVISFVLGFSNLLPIPALDGGRIIFVLLEWIRRGKRISAKTEGLVHGVGFVLLLALLVFISFKDILRIING